MKIGEIGERELIRQIAAVVAKTADMQAVGIGDDAALTKVSEGSWLVTSKDMLVQGVHFLLPEMSARDLGYKALAVNISDIAAMGGLPKHAFVALALPPQTESEFVLDFYRGMMELAEEYAVSVSGGDIVGSPGPLVISVTVQGEAARNNALLRSGGCAGDVVCTTGPLGASAAGLLLLTNGIECPSDIRTAALKAHFRPRPRVAEAAWLAESGAVSAAMDMSDGLLKDLQEILEASSCGAFLYEEQIPVHPAAAAVASVLNRSPLDLAINGGEDYEILCTVSQRRYADINRAYQAYFKKELYPIGRLTQETGLRMVTKAGKWAKLEFTGYQHF